MVHKAAFPGKTCLISTANALYGELIDSALQQIGMSELHGASDIEDAIRRASVVAFDVIICADAEMNLALDMMHRIRKASPRSPVIIVTSQVSSEYLATVAEEGAAFVVAMPINTRKLLKTLNRAINEKRAPAARPPEHRPGPPYPSAPPPGARLPQPPRDPRTAPPPADPGQMLSARDEKLLFAAGQISASIEQLKQSLSATDDAAHRRLLRSQMADAAQRLVNLLALEKVEDGGALAGSLAEKLHFVRESFFDVIAEICRSRVEMVKADLNKYSERQGFVVGSADAIFERLASIEEIITVMGGPRKLDTDMKLSMANAWSDAMVLQEAEKTALSLKELAPVNPTTTARATPKQRYSYEVDVSADSQSSVLTAIKSQKEK